MTPGCTGKVRYRSFTSAERAAKWQSRRHDESFSAYHCTRCHGFHTGEAIGHIGQRKNIPQPRKEQ